MTSRNSSRRRPRTRLEPHQKDGALRSPRIPDSDAVPGPHSLIDSHYDAEEGGSYRGRERYKDDVDVSVRRYRECEVDGQSTSEVYSMATKLAPSRGSRRDAMDGGSSRGRERYKDNFDVCALRDLDDEVEESRLDHAGMPVYATRATTPKKEIQNPMPISKPTSDYRVEVAIQNRTRARSASASRGKSRTTDASAPLPSPRLLPSTGPSPRRFLPPSHYAAAAGIHYERSEHDIQQNSITASGPPSESSIYVQPFARSRSSTISSLPSSSSNHSQYLAGSSSTEPSPFIPVAFQSTGQFSPVTDEPSSRSLLSRSLSKSKSSKREQQSGTTLATRASLMGLPTLEANLLPSLRDTIDRMTNPQSIPHSTSHAATYPFPRNSPSMTTISPAQVPVSSPPSNMQSTLSAPPRNPSALPSRNRSPSSANLSESHISAPPSPLSLSSPTTQTTPLKSALRGARERERTITQENWSPMSDTSSPQTSYDAPPNTPSVVKGSLRTTKRMVTTRQSPASSCITTPRLDEPRTPKLGGTPRLSEGRVQTTAQRSAIPVLQKSPAKASRSRTELQPQTLSPTEKFHLPLRTSPRPSSPSTSSGSASSQVRRYLTAAHPLKVMNANNSPSSEEESDMHARRPQGVRTSDSSIESQRHRHARWYSSDEALDNDSGIQAPPASIDSVPSDLDDIASVSDSEPQYTVSHDSKHHVDDDSEFDRTLRKRREALIGIVNGLGLDMPFPEDPTVSFSSGNTGSVINQDKTRDFVRSSDDDQAVYSECGEESEYSIEDGSDGWDDSSPLQPQLFLTPTLPSTTTTEQQRSRGNGYSYGSMGVADRSPNMHVTDRRRSPLKLPAPRRNMTFPPTVPTSRSSLFEYRQNDDHESQEIPTQIAVTDGRDLDQFSAARQRQAFGIPPSESDVGDGFGNGSLAHAESDLSSVGELLRQEETQGLSVAAQALFEQLKLNEPKSIKTTSEARSQVNVNGRSAHAFEHSSKDETREDFVDFSDHNSGISVYSDAIPTQPWQREAELGSDLSSSQRSWRSMLRSAEFQSLQGHYGELEICRQEVIWELCETEQAFVKGLHAVIRLFVLPLRTQDRSWIPGLPESVTRLFDWLEDIVHLHTGISSSLHDVRTSQYPVILRVAENLRSFIPKLEVYQPYLVKLESVVQTIDNMEHDPQSDFGEFVRIQSSLENENSSLTTSLTEPAKRLGQYLDLFKGLLEFTPQAHPDHLPTFSLVHSANMVIRTLREVKAREDEYHFVKDLSTHIENWPTSVQLARRERRLLARGPVDLTNENPSQDTLNHRRCHPCPPEFQTIPDHSQHQVRPRDRFVGHVHRRSGSFNSVLSKAFSSEDDSGSMPLRDTFRSQRRSRSFSSGIQESSDNPSSSRWRTRAAFFQGEQADIPDRGLTSNSHLESATYAFVFTDMLLLTTTVQQRRSHDTSGSEKWRLRQDAGLYRVLGVRERSRGSDDDYHIDLEALPMSMEELDSGVIPNNAVATSLSISLPLSASEPQERILQIRQDWTSALRTCCQYTLQSLSFPSQTGKYLTHGPNFDLQSDTRLTVMSILASGLPLPKSPSLQIEEIQLGEASNSIQQEREERGWWALRFQQVLREFQRRDIPVP